MSALTSAPAAGAPSPVRPPQAQAPKPVSTQNHPRAATDSMAPEDAQHQLRSVFAKPAPEVPQTTFWSSVRDTVVSGLEQTIPLFDWRVGRYQLNYLYAINDKLTESSGPYNFVPGPYFGLPCMFALGTQEFMRRNAERAHEQYGPNKAWALEAKERGQEVDPYLPDGDTWWFKSVAKNGLPPAVLVVSGASAIKHVLGNPNLGTADRGHDPAFGSMQRLIGKGLFSGPTRRPNNEEWKHARSIANHAFGAKELNDFVPGMQATLKDAIAALRDIVQTDPNHVFDTQEVCAYIAYAMVMRGMFQGVEDGLRDRIVKPLEEARQLRANLPFGGDASELHKTEDLVRREVQNLIDGLKNADLAEDIRALPIVKYLCDDAESLPQKIGLALALIVGGHETTGRALSWALYELDRHPDVADAIRTEYAAFKARHTDAEGRLDINTDNYHEMATLSAFFAEIYRLHNPIMRTVRMAEGDGFIDPDPDTGIGAVYYREGTLFLVNLRGIHMNPQIWPEPEAFSIERWLPNPDSPEDQTALDAHAQKNFSASFDALNDAQRAQAMGSVVRRRISEAEREYRLVTFGAGPAACVGKGFNNLELRVILPELLEHFDHALIDPDIVPEDTSEIISGPEPGSCNMRLKARR